MYGSPIQIHTVRGVFCSATGKPLHIGPLKSLLNLVGNSEHNVSCHSAKSAGILTYKEKICTCQVFRAEQVSLRVKTYLATFTNVKIKGMTRGSDWLWGLIIKYLMGELVKYQKNEHSFHSDSPVASALLACKQTFILDTGVGCWLRQGVKLPAIAPKAEIRSGKTPCLQASALQEILQLRYSGEKHVVFKKIIQTPHQLSNGPSW